MALASEIGCVRKIRSGSVRLRNWKPSKRKTSADATTSTMQQAGERLLLRLVVAGQFPAIAGRELQLRQQLLELAGHAAQVVVVPNSAVTVITGCWFSRHSSLGLRLDLIDATWPKSTKPGPGAASRGRGTLAAGVAGRARLIGSLRQPVAVVADRVRVADADVRDAVLLGQACWPPARTGPR